MSVYNCVSSPASPWALHPMLHGEPGGLPSGFISILALSLAHIPSFVVQFLNPIRLFGTLWTVARQVFLSFVLSQSLLRLMSIESVMPSNHLTTFFSCLQSVPASGSFPVSWHFVSSGQSIAASAAASVLMNIQGWFPLGLIGLISLAYSHWSSLTQSLQTFPAPTHLCLTFLIFPVLGTTFCLPPQTHQNVPNLFAIALLEAPFPPLVPLRRGWYNSDCLLLQEVQRAFSVLSHELFCTL